MAFAPPSGAELMHLLGVGSIFEVALVRHGETVCVCKRLSSRMRSEPRAHAAVEREVRFLSMAAHAALPRLIRHAKDERGPYILQTRAEGSSIAALVESGPVPADMLAELVRATFQALAEIHALPNQLALGDLAPDDLFVGQSRGAVCFVDFGQSSWRGRPPDAAERGTLPYAPPEVVRGEALWTQASDVYALAAVMLFAALGREPCNNRGPGRITEIGEHGIDRELFERSELPAPTRRCLAAALAFEPGARVSAASEVLKALDD